MYDEKKTMKYNCDSQGSREVYSIENLTQPVNLENINLLRINFIIQTSNKSKERRRIKLHFFKWQCPTGIF